MDVVFCILVCIVVHRKACSVLLAALVDTGIVGVVFANVHLSAIFFLCIEDDCRQPCRRILLDCLPRGNVTYSADMVTHLC